MLYNKLGEYIPLLKDVQDMIHISHNLPDSKLYVLDLPRMVSKQQLNSLWPFVEQLKNGIVYDTRYHFNRRMLKDVPAIWVFMNEEPDYRYLSLDRWNIWLVDQETEVAHPIVPKNWKS